MNTVKVQDRLLSEQVTKQRTPETPAQPVLKILKGAVQCRTPARDTEQQTSDINLENQDDDPPHFGSRLHRPNLLLSS